MERGSLANISFFFTLKIECGISIFKFFIWQTFYILKLTNLKILYKSSAITTNLTSVATYLYTNVDSEEIDGS